MAKSIISIAQAIGIIGKEVEDMFDKKVEKEPELKLNKYCIECNNAVTHPGANFCRICAESFYNDEEENE